MNEIVIENVKLFEFEEQYHVSKCGRIYSTKSNIFMKLRVDKYGYEYVKISLCGKQRHKLIHRIVLKTFNGIVNSENLQVNHIDSNRVNNNIVNLEWVTSKENVSHSIAFGHEKVSGVDNNNSKLSDEDIVYIRANYKKGCGKTREALIKKFEIKKSMYYNIINNTHWKHIE